MSAAAVSAASIAAAAESQAATDTKLAEQNREVMQAATQDKYGDASVVHVREITKPTPGAKEVVIDVEAAGLDRGVVHLMNGLPYLIRFIGYGLRRPKNPVLGADVAGRVAAVGSEVTRFEVGDAVMGIAKGSFAEFAKADEAKLTHKPETLSIEHAAVSPISGITAVQALTTEGKVQSGDRVLVIGASGGVGSFAVQIAVAHGATVTGVASGGKADRVLALGASEVIDYTTTKLSDVQDEFDLIIDTGGLNPLGVLRGLLAADGRLVIVGGEGGSNIAGGINRQLRAAILSLFTKQSLGFFIGDEGGEHLDALVALLEAGSVVPAIGSRFSLEEVPDAIRALEAGSAFGKTAIIIESEEGVR